MKTFVHMELNTSDVEGAKKFYKGVFGWKYQKAKMQDGSTYSIILGADGGFGGVQANPSPDAPPHWLGYVGVESVKRTVAKVEKRGGKTLMGPLDVPGMGSLAIFADPQGAVFAVWQAEQGGGQPDQATQQASETASKKKASKKKASKKASKKKAATKASEKKTAKAKPNEDSGKKASGKKKAAKKVGSKKKAAKKVSSKKKTAKK